MAQITLTIPDDLEDKVRAILTKYNMHQDIQILQSGKAVELMRILLQSEIDNLEVYLGDNVLYCGGNSLGDVLTEEQQTAVLKHNPAAEF